MSDITVHIAEHKFRDLFVEHLGWDSANGQLATVVDQHEYALARIAHKRGFQVLHCPVDRLTIIDRGRLRRIQKRVLATAHEHILIYSSDDPPRQVWQWAVRLPNGRRLRHREHPFFSDSPPRQLLQRINGLAFALDEEEQLTLVDALQRVRAALDTTAELNLFVNRPRYARKSDALARRMKSGDRADFEAFVLFHRPLVRWVARRLSRSFRIDVEDAEQTGMFGLIHAAERFDPDRGMAFSTYATLCIQGFCKREGPAAGQLIRVPQHVTWPCYAIRAQLDRLLTCGPECARRFLDNLRATEPKLAAAFTRFLLATNWQSLSDRTSSAFREARQIPERHDDPLQSTIRSKRAEAVRAAVARLHERHARILRLRYGLDGLPQTLEQVGRSMGLTRERVRQIQVKAEERLRRLLLAAMPSLSESQQESDAEDTRAESEGD